MKKVTKTLKKGNHNTGKPTEIDIRVIVDGEIIVDEFMDAINYNIEKETIDNDDNIYHNIRIVTSDCINKKEKQDG